MILKPAMEDQMPEASKGFAAGKWLRILRVQGTPQSIGTWVFGGDSHVFTGFCDRARRLTQRMRLKRAIFEVYISL